MMCRKDWTRRLAVVLMSLILVSVYSFGTVGSGRTYATDEKTYKDSSGVTYLLDTENHTATMFDIDSGVTTVNVPAKITVPADGEYASVAGDYDVTAVWPRKGRTSGSTSYDSVTEFTMAEGIRTMSHINLGGVLNITIPASVETIDSVRIGPYINRYGTVTSTGENISNYKGSVTFASPSSLHELRDIEFNTVTTIDLPDSIQSMKGYFRVPQVEDLTIPGTNMPVFDGQISAGLNLKTLTFGDGIGEITKTISSCEKLEKVVLPNNPVKISTGGIFSNLESLTTVENMKNVAEGSDGSSMFDGCTALKEITIPASLTPGGKVPNGMFGTAHCTMWSSRGEGDFPCASLEKVTFEGEITSVGNYSFEGADKLTSVTVNAGSNPVEIQNAGLTEIGDYAFKGTGLTGEFDLSKCGSIGKSAFEGMKGMTGKADLRKLSDIPDRAFKGTNITEVLFSDSLKTIGSSSFMQTKLKTVDIPDSVTEIGGYAFWNIGTLKEVKIGNGVTTLSDDVFRYCWKLEKVEIGSGIKSIGDNVFDKTSIKKSENVVINSSPNYVRVNKIGDLTKDQITFTIPGDPDPNDQVVTSGKSLQEAVNEGGTVTIEKNIYLKKPLIIPERKEVTIKSTKGEDGKWRSISGAMDFSGDDLISVSGGSSLILQDVTVNGTNSDPAGGHGLIDVAGILTINDGATIKQITMTEAGSAGIRASGKGAEVIMDGGLLTGVCLDNNSFSPEGSGSIVLDSGAHMRMKKGTISKNVNIGKSARIIQKWTSGIYVDGGSTLDMSGGTISENTSNAGSAIFVNSGTLQLSKEAMISYNHSENKVGMSFDEETKTMNTPCCGAVYLAPQTTGTMTGGTIKSNTGDTGGGIAVDRDATFHMTGGTIQGNQTTNGGGIYSYSNKTLLEGGTITDNTATNHGGGVYAEGNRGTYSTTHFRNAVITGNTASFMGGGIWICPTGRVNMEKNSALVAANEASAEGAGDDFALEQNGTEVAGAEGSGNNISNRALGGSKLTYYRDGGITPSLDPSVEGGINHSIPRYAEAEKKEKITVISDGNEKFNRPAAMKSIADNDDTAQLIDLAENAVAKKQVAEPLVIKDNKAEEKQVAKPLVIKGNKARRGAGVGANGGISFDGGGNKKIKIAKQWEGGNAPVDQVKVDIFADGYKIETVTLTEKDGWTKTIEGLPDDVGTITAREVPVDGYEAAVEVSQDANDETLINVTVTNSKKPDNPPETEKTEVSVEKVWKGDEAKDRPESISVQLMRDGKAYGEAVSLSEANSWSHKWTDLDKDHEWSVEEVAVPEGYNSVTSHDGNSWIITNTKTNPEKPGGDNPEPVTPDEPNEPTKPSGGNGHTTDTTSHKTVRKTEVRTPGGYYVVRTGDSKEALIYTGLFTAAAAGAVYVSIRRRKKAAKAGR